MKGSRWIAAITLLGFCLFTGAVAATIGHSAATPTGPDYGTWFTILVGVVTMLLGAYAAVNSRRIDRVENDLRAIQNSQNTHRLDMALNHPTKDDLARIEMKVESLHTRFDKAHYPSAFPVREDR